MSATLSFSNLFTFDLEDSSERLPLDKLADDGGHVHGLLEIEISGRSLPHLGFFGPDDVCFNTWIEELLHITRTLNASEIGEHTFDEGEQGQPAFAFERRGDLLNVSVVDSALSEASGDASFQNVSCSWAEFQSAFADFSNRFHAALRDACPQLADQWWETRHARLGGEPSG